VVACAGGATNTEYDVKVNYFGAVATLDGLRPLLANGNAPRAVAVCSICSFWAPSMDVVENCLRGDEAAAFQSAIGLPRSVAYASAKRALALWLRRVAPSPEWAGLGIGINAIGPGTILTAPMLEMFKDPEILEATNRFLPMPYGGHSTPEQLAPTLAFLASEECAVMTGQLIYVDGGVDVCFRGEDIYSWNDGNAARILAG
jgi:NAD(P)-dependent dehydrogenase (short-subunit alcohol dehydrogenase family)